MRHGKIKEIFEDNWTGFQNKYPVRECVVKEVEKMLKCRDLSQGYSEYCCHKCNERKFVAFTCKSRFCTSCGKRATEDWVEELNKELMDVPHRHIVFTIPQDLRQIFLRDRNLLKVLSDCASETIIS